MKVRDGRTTVSQKYKFMNDAHFKELLYKELSHETYGEYLYLCFYAAALGIFL